MVDEVDVFPELVADAHEGEAEGVDAALQSLEEVGCHELAHTKFSSADGDALEASDGIVVACAVEEVERGGVEGEIEAVEELCYLGEGGSVSDVAELGAACEWRQSVGEAAYVVCVVVFDYGGG